MTKFFNKFQSPCFQPIFSPFSQFWRQKKFSDNPALSSTTSYGFLAPCQNLEKTDDAIPRKHPDGRTDGRKDRPYFIGHFRLPPGVHKAI